MVITNKDVILNRLYRGTLYPRKCSYLSVTEASIFTTSNGTDADDTEFGSAILSEIETEETKARLLWALDYYLNKLEGSLIADGRKNGILNLDIENKIRHAKDALLDLRGKHPRFQFHSFLTNEYHSAALCEALNAYGEHYEKLREDFCSSLGFETRLASLDGEIEILNRLRAVLCR
jgi:hypothetical protein